MVPNPASRACTQYFLTLPLTSIVVKQSVMKQVIAKYPTENVRRGGRGCSYKQVIFSYHKFQDQSTLAQSLCYKHSLVTLEQLDTAKFLISSSSFFFKVSSPIPLLPPIGYPLLHCLIENFFPVIFITFKRSVSYLEFSRLVYGMLGNKRILLPACVYVEN